MCHNNEWGTVCDDDWSTNDGMVACGQLGLSYVRITISASFGEGEGMIWLSNLLCRGSESQLLNCSHSGFGAPDCDHSKDAGVVCASKSVLLIVCVGKIKHVGGPLYITDIYS